MKLTVTYDDNVVQLDVDQDMELENLIAYCQAEMDTSFSNLQLLHNARPLEDMKKTLRQYGITDGDMVLVVNKAMLQQTHARQTAVANAAGLPSSQTTSSGGSGTSGGTLGGAGLSAQQAEELLSITEVTMEQAARVRDSFLNNPAELANLRMSNLSLADAMGSLDEFHKVLNEQHKRKRDQQLRRIRMMTADPFDIEAQKMIAEEIQRQQIDSNMHDAIEFMPEVFGQVHMLYIKCKVNGTPIDAFVDSGAQSTIMSQACAERCNITRLIDERWSGMAHGVGTQKILGRIHLCQLQIENDFLPSSFNVLEHQPMDMLLGLDILKRHQCVLDLKNNILRIGTTGTETRFLNESELPAHARPDNLS